MAMLFCAVISLLVTGFAFALIVNEFRGRWDQIVSAMMFEDAEIASQPVNPQSVRLVLPAVVRSQVARPLPLRRAAA